MWNGQFVTLIGFPTKKCECDLSVTNPRKIYQNAIFVKTFCLPDTPQVSSLHSPLAARKCEIKSFLELLFLHWWRRNDYKTGLWRCYSRSLRKESVKTFFFISGGTETWYASWTVWSWGTEITVGSRSVTISLIYNSDSRIFNPPRWQMDISGPCI